MNFQHKFFSGGSEAPLNFDPGEFHSDDFSVDEFIQRKRQSVPLDVLRDDLGCHLKSLRSSLIELINQDYGQFVNLSSNLVGLDGRIQSIVGPLSRAKNDLQGFDQLLETNISGLSEELNKKRTLRESKAQLHYIRMSSTALELSAKLIAKLPSEIVSSLDFNLLRSTCDEVAEAKFLLHSCELSPLQQNLYSKWSDICNEVLKRLNSLLKIYVDVDTTDKMDDECSAVTKSLLYMYTELQCEPVVEDVLVKQVLVPKCEAVLSNRGNVGALLDAMELFLKQSPLFKIWNNLQDSPWMANYDFIEKGMFSCVFGILCKHFPHIWSPSNPDSFHSHWTRCEKFISTLEDAMPSTDHLQKFRNSDVFKDFNSKWQFPVYFQLRFHGIATELESALEDIIAPCSTNDFKLDSTRVMIKTLNECWDKENIYITRISGRFIKASALIISRYIKEIQLKVASNKNTSIQDFINVYCDLNLAELVTRQILAEKMIQELHLEDSDNSSDFQASLFSGFSWDEAKRAIEDTLVQVAISQSSNSISAVNEVPRLYRRTNRDSPTKPLEYVDAILLPISSLKDEICSAHQKDLWENIGNRIGSEILNRYQAQVKDVLVSVQRMEESLRRLKKVKGQNQTDNTKGQTATTDDDKIRLQIQLDVNYFVQKMEKVIPLLDTARIKNLTGTVNGIS